MIQLSNDKKRRLLKFMLLGNEFRFEISYSDRYLKKVKQLFAKSTPRRE